MTVWLLRAEITGLESSARACLTRTGTAPTVPLGQKLRLVIPQHLSALPEHTSTTVAATFRALDVTHRGVTHCLERPV